MKYTSILALAAFALACAAPTMAADSPELEKAVELASRDSKAGLDAICLATYKAVKADPDHADKVFEAVLGQRADWKASEVYAIFRSVLLARPDLIDEIKTVVNVQRAKATQENGGDPAKQAASVGLVGAVTETDTVSPMLARLVNVVYEAGLPAGVAEEAVNMTFASVAGTYAYTYQGAFEQIGVNTNHSEPSIAAPREFDDFIILIPTPAPMSPN